MQLPSLSDVLATPFEEFHGILATVSEERRRHSHQQGLEFSLGFAHCSEERDALLLECMHDCPDIHRRLVRFIYRPAQL